MVDPLRRCRGRCLDDRLLRLRGQAGTGRLGRGGWDGATARAGEVWAGEVWVEDSPPVPLCGGPHSVGGCVMTDTLVAAGHERAVIVTVADISESPPAYIPRNGDTSA